MMKMMKSSGVGRGIKCFRLAKSVTLLIPQVQCSHNCTSQTLDWIWLNGLEISWNANDTSSLPVTHATKESQDKGSQNISQLPSNKLPPTWVSTSNAWQVLDTGSQCGNHPKLPSSYAKHPGHPDARPQVVEAHTWGPRTDSQNCHAKTSSNAKMDLADVLKILLRVKEETPLFCTKFSRNLPALDRSWILRSDCRRGSGRCSQAWRTSQPPGRWCDLHVLCPCQSISIKAPFMLAAIIKEPCRFLGSVWGFWHFSDTACCPSLVSLGYRAYGIGVHLAETRCHTLGTHLPGIGVPIFPDLLEGSVSSAQLWKETA